MTKTQLNEMSLIALTAVYNTYATKTIKKFTCSKAEAVERVLKVLPAQPKAKSTVERGGKGPGPRTGVCAQMTELFSKGMSPKEVFAWIQDNMPAARTSLKAVHWYKSHLRSLGATV